MGRAFWVRCGSSEALKRRASRNQKAWVVFGIAASEPVAAVGDPPAKNADGNSGQQRPQDGQAEIGYQTEGDEDAPEDFALHSLILARAIAPGQRVRERVSRLNCTANCRTMEMTGDMMALTLKRRSKQARRIERVEARLNPEQKRRIEHAASLAGTSVSDFMVSSAEVAAVRAIEQHEVWTLTNRDREVFVKAMLNPPAPSARMKAAARRYRSGVNAW